MNRLILTMCLTALIAGCRGTTIPRLSTADLFIRDFPDHLDNALDVQKFPTPNSRYCLIHLRQIHYLPFHRILNECRAILKRIPDDPFYNELRQSVQALITDNLSKNKSSYQAIQNCQSDIYHLALNLRDHWNIRSLRSEGLFMPVNGMEFRQEYRIRLQAIMDTGLFSSTEPIRFVPGADLILGMNQQMNVRDCDSFSAVQRAAKNNNARFDQREEHVLNIIANWPDPVVPVLYGGDHQFLDNIQLWNQRHPRRRFSLIVITPQHYPQND